jgi:transcriptional regulator with XRE-family HTH domain
MVSGKQIPSPFPTAKKVRVPKIEVRQPVEPKRSTISSKVGAQIRSLRLAAGSSAGALAASAGVSRSMFSRIENGLVSPSIEVLDRIAAALDVPMSRFFVDQTRRLDLSFVPAGKGLKVERVDAVAGYTYQLLGHLLSGNLFVEPYLVTLSDEARPYTTFQHPGLKFIYMLSGRVKYRYGSHTLELKPGDSLLYDARALHGAELLREGPIAYLSVVFTLRE